MLVKIYQVKVEYIRNGKHGEPHKYFRNRNMAVLKCDSCDQEFERRVSDMDHRRLTTDYSHVCANCNPKQFAQKKAVEGRRFWNTTVDLDLDIDSL